MGSEVARESDSVGSNAVPAFCTQCRSRCGCIAVVENGKLTAVEPDPAHPTGAKLCPKGRAAPELVYHPDRLTTPLRRTSPKGAAEPGWQPISWDAALAEIAGRMRTLEAEGFRQFGLAGLPQDGMDAVGRVLSLRSQPQLR